MSGVVNYSNHVPRVCRSGFDSMFDELRPFVTVILDTTWRYSIWSGHSHPPEMPKINKSRCVGFCAARNSARTAWTVGMHFAVTNLDKLSWKLEGASEVTATPLKNPRRRLETLF